MKRKNTKPIVFCLAFVFCLPSFSARLGFKTGMSYSGARVSGDFSYVMLKEDTIDIFTIGEWKGDNSYSSFGMFIQLDISKKISFQPEIYYTSKGIERDLFGGSLAQKWKFNYIELPLLLKFNLGSDTSINPVVFTGPYLAYLISSKWKYILRFSDAEDLFVEETDRLKRLDYGIVFGGGIEFIIGELKLVFDIRYNLGLPNVTVSSNERFTSIKNSTFVMSLGFGFKKF